MARQPQKARIQFTPKPELRALLEKLSEMNGLSLAATASELLDEIAPVIEGQIEAMKVIASRPEQAAELMSEFANRQMHTIAQANLEFGETQKKRGRKNGTP